MRRFVRNAHKLEGLAAEQPRRISLTVDGVLHKAEVEPATTLLQCLRYDLAKTAPKEACGRGECGACTVLVDETPVLSCVELVARVDGRAITTSDGLGERGNQLAEALVERGGMQCGFCTPGHVVRASTLTGPATEIEIRRAISGNICRCTGYSQIVDAIGAVLEGGHE